MTRRILALTLTAIVVATAAPNPTLAQDATWQQVSAIFDARCVGCHMGPSPPNGLRLDSLDAVLAGGDNGPVLIAGDPDASELVKRIRGESQPAMPLGGDPLSADQIATIEAWVAAGLPPDAGAPDEAPAPDSAASAADQPADDVEAPADGVTPDEAAPAAALPPGPGDIVTYADVAPIFLQNCVRCHVANGMMGAPPDGVMLDSYANVLNGGERLALLPGNLAVSEIVRRITGTAMPRMPFDGPPFLSDSDINLIARWIEVGAPDVNGVPAPIPVGAEVRLRGTFTGPSEIDGAVFIVDGATRIDEMPRIGDEAEMEGVVTGDGTVRAIRLRAR